MNNQEQEAIARWSEVADKNPVILFERGWSELKGDSDAIAAIYCAAAKKDPTNAVRLIGHIADRAFAKDVLVEAFKAFPPAAETYRPMWENLRCASEIEQLAVESEKVAADGRIRQDWADRIAHVPIVVRSKR